MKAGNCFKIEMEMELIINKSKKGDERSEENDGKSYEDKSERERNVLKEMEAEEIVN